MAKTTKKTQKRIETLTHEADSRKNIPTAEYESVMEADDRSPIAVAYERRDRLVRRSGMLHSCGCEMGTSSHRIAEHWR